MDQAPIASVEYRLLCGCIYAILSIFGIMAHSFIIFLFIKRRKFLLKTAFHLLALQMCICDLMLLIVQLLIAVPLTITANNIYSDLIFIYNAGTFCETVFFNALSFMTLLMAINRLTVFSSTTINRLIFEGKFLFGLILSTYLLCFSGGTIRHFFGCTKDFSTKGFYFYFTCIEGTLGKSVYNVAFIKDIVVPVIMLLIYFGLFFYLRAYRRFINRKLNVLGKIGHPEYKLLVQGAIVCFFLEMEVLAFDFFSKIPVTGMGIHYLTFTQNLIQIMNNCVSPIIYFTFNKDIRSYALETLGIGLSLISNFL